MGHRLSRIYTRTGDSGTTGMGDGTRVEKDDPRIEAIGSIDELNCQIGLLLSQELPDNSLRPLLTDIQHDLFDMGGELCIPDVSNISQRQVDYLENSLDQLNSKLSPLKEFILPGGCESAAICHVARAVCRRAERRVHTLSKQKNIPDITLKYLNRLSDLLFVIARHLNAASGHGDVLWQPGKNR